MMLYVMTVEQFKELRVLDFLRDDVKKAIQQALAEREQLLKAGAARPVSDEPNDQD